jgi:hypothetical protein
LEVIIISSLFSTQIWKMAKTKGTKGKTKAKAKVASDGLHRSERARRSKLPEEHKLRISPEDPMFLPAQRQSPMQRYGKLLPRFYRYFITGTREWVTWDANPKEMGKALRGW